MTATFGPGPEQLRAIVARARHQVPCTTNLELERAMASAVRIAKCQLLLWGPAPLPLTLVLGQGRLEGSAVEFLDATGGGEGDAESDRAELASILHVYAPERIVMSGAVAAVIVLPSELMEDYDGDTAARPDIERIDLLGADAAGRVQARSACVRRDQSGGPLACEFIRGRPLRPVPPAILVALARARDSRSFK